MQIGTSIPMSPQVANATNSGEPIMSSLPKHAVSVAIKGLAKQLAATALIPAQNHVATTSKTRVAVTPKRGLLRRNGR
jgi:MinD-like ATPase involved in chromosome partitioning or flagellar assembly